MLIRPDIRHSTPMFWVRGDNTPFSAPVHRRGIEKCSGDSKPDHWLNDYLTAAEMANGEMGNTLLYVPLCLTSSAHTWHNDVKPNSIHSLADFEAKFINNFEGTH